MLLKYFYPILRRIARVIYLDFTLVIHFYVTTVLINIFMYVGVSYCGGGK